MTVGLLTIVCSVVCLFLERSSAAGGAAAAVAAKTNQNQTKISSIPPL